MSRSRGVGDADEGVDEGVDEAAVVDDGRAEHVGVHAPLDEAEEDEGGGLHVARVLPARQQARDAIDEGALGGRGEGVELGVAVPALGEHGVQARIGAVDVHHERHHRAHALAHLGGEGRGGVSCLEGPERSIGHLHEATEGDLAEQRVLVREVLVDGAGGHAGVGGDPLGRGGRVAELGERSLGRREQAAARLHRSRLLGRADDGVRAGGHDHDGCGQI